MFYSRDMVARLKNSTQPEPVDSEHRNYPLMGGIGKDTPKEHEHFIEAQDLVVAPANGSRADSEETLLVNSGSHLLREAKVLARVEKESNGSKPRAILVFGKLTPVVTSCS